MYADFLKFQLVVTQNSQIEDKKSNERFCEGSPFTVTPNFLPLASIISALKLPDMQKTIRHLQGREHNLAIRRITTINRREGMKKKNKSTESCGHCLVIAITIDISIDESEKLGKASCC